MNNKRILFTGGGTAGHVMVNLALIPVYQQAGWQIDYIGSHDGIEKTLIEPLEGVTYHGISTGKLRRYISKENLKDPFKVVKGTLQAWRIIGRVKPAVIFSKGGFVSVPVVLAAKLRGVPTIIHESDYTPGLANKIAIPFVQKVLATFPETMAFLPEKKAEYVGAVIRDDLFQGDRKRGLELTGLTEEKPVLLIMGGSGGAQAINDTIRNVLDQLLDSVQIIHICGHGKTDPSIKQTGYVQFEYVNETLKDILAASDFVVSRAGANAIFEFLALRIPMLLIPLSRQASRGDQIINARSFLDKKYARVLEEEELTEASLVHEIMELTKAAPVMRDYMKAFESKKARDQVHDIIQHAIKH
ncbi:undecaprenyldiphospho-muramoylpentapeptide beta-N-acetylglucosaminyltransferase [Lentibacillus saliphilus]|uniref:undecaprenyldiphospho-muramoylpentapeptide beta-N-acetylglucosaminyltransferase n=1 Tax=Lentibacillus saliphilus TaxID=2737028 RepID=UPI001C310867|nr:undecaprenyldiphospho-muramoylpentapeptide beta-N-acetylglucosaminyltransferase [Lentibacillus saliphilus]